MSDGTISKYCSDNSPEPKAIILNEICNIFNVDPGEFMNIDMTKQVLTNADNMAILICKKLIKETKLNLCKWEKVDISDAGQKENKKNEDIADKCFNDEYEFESKFTNDLHDKGDIIGYYTVIDEIGTFMIVKLDMEYDEDEPQDKYELYVLNEDNEVIDCCVNYYVNDSVVYNERFSIVLSNLYDLAKDYKRMDIFHRYLKLNRF